MTQLNQGQILELLNKKCSEYETQIERLEQIIEEQDAQLRTLIKWIEQAHDHSSTSGEQRPKVVAQPEKQRA